MDSNISHTILDNPPHLQCLWKLFAVKFKASFAVESLGRG